MSSVEPEKSDGDENQRRAMVMRTRDVPRCGPRCGERQNDACVTKREDFAGFRDASCHAAILSLFLLSRLRHCCRRRRCLPAHFLLHYLEKWNDQRNASARTQIRIYRQIFSCSILAISRVHRRVHHRHRLVRPSQFLRQCPAQAHNN